MRQTETSRWLKYNFTDAEQREHARQLARANRELAQLELTKKEVVSSLKAKADAQTAEVGRLAEFINNGYEYRTIQCRIDFDLPEPGRKQVIRLDNGEVVEELKMDDSDKQEELPLAAAD